MFRSFHSRLPMLSAAFRVCVALLSASLLSGCAVVYTILEGEGVTVVAQLEDADGLRIDAVALLVDINTVAERQPFPHTGFLSLHLSDRSPGIILLVHKGALAVPTDVPLDAVVSFCGEYYLGRTVQTMRQGEEFRPPRYVPVSLLNQRDESGAVLPTPATEYSLLVLKRLDILGKDKAAPSSNDPTRGK